MTYSDNHNMVFGGDGLRYTPMSLNSYVMDDDWLLHYKLDAAEWMQGVYAFVVASTTYNRSTIQLN